MSELGIKHNFSLLFLHNCCGVYIDAVLQCYLNWILCEIDFCSSIKEGCQRQTISMGEKMLSVFWLCARSKNILNDVDLLLRNIHVLVWLPQDILLTWVILIKYSNFLVFFFLDKLRLLETMGLRYTYNKELIVKDFCEIVSRRLFITRTDLKRKICGKTAKK